MYLFFNEIRKVTLLHFASSLLLYINDFMKCCLFRVHQETIEPWIFIWRQKFWTSIICTFWPLSLVTLHLFLLTSTLLPAFTVFDTYKKINMSDFPLFSLETIDFTLHHSKMWKKDVTVHHFSSLKQYIIIPELLMVS